MTELSRRIRTGSATNRPGKAAITRLSQGQNCKLEKFLRIARLAGMSDRRAAAFWAREQIPDSHAALKSSVGCTVRRWRIIKPKPNTVEAEADRMLMELLREERLAWETEAQ